MKKEAKRVTNYYRTRKGIVSRIYTKQVQSSKDREHPLPSYTKEELGKWLFSQPNFEQLYENWVKSDYEKDLKPSIDRKDDYLPYTLLNIQLMTWKENKEKGHNDRKNGVNNKHSLKVEKYSLKGIFIEDYNSVNEASRKNNCSPSAISECCRGIRNKHKSYIWKYKTNKL